MAWYSGPGDAIASHCIPWLRLYCFYTTAFHCDCSRHECGLHHDHVQRRQTSTPTYGIINFALRIAIVCKRFSDCIIRRMVSLSLYWLCIYSTLTWILTDIDKCHMWTSHTRANHANICCLVLPWFIQCSPNFNYQNIVCTFLFVYQAKYIVIITK